MLKLFLNSKLFIIIVIATTILNVVNYYHYEAYQGFSLDKSDSSLLIVLNNGKYFELTPTNDLIDDGSLMGQIPFVNGGQTETGTTGIDFAFWSRKYIAVTNSDNNYRRMEINRYSGNNIVISINAKLTSNLSSAAYYTQLDYSGTAIFKNNLDNVTVEVDKCELKFPKSINYDVFNYNSRSIRIRRKYNNVINFEVNFSINCPS